MDYSSMKEKVNDIKENGYTEVYSEQDSKDLSVMLHRIGWNFKTTYYSTAFGNWYAFKLTY